MTIKSVDIRSCARIVAVIYAVWGLIAGFAMFAASAANVSWPGGSSAGLPGVLFGPGAIVFMPVLYAVLAYLFAAVACWIFNWAAATLGGLEIEVE